MPARQRLDTQAQILALVQAQAKVRATLTRQAVALAEQSTASFSDWYDRAAITAWASTLADRVEPVQRLLAQSTDAYLARVLSLLTGGRVAPVGRVDVSGLRFGVTHAGAYGRVADTYRWQQSRFDSAARALLTEVVSPPDLQPPLTAALERAAAVADYDAQLAVRAQSQQAMEAAHTRGLVTGYRRVIHPEQARGGSCGLCVAASDRLYGAKELLPIHRDCHCTTLPVIDNADPGSVLNRADLNRLYKDAGGSTSAGALKATRYQVDEHGELGPVLNPKGAKVRTAGQARRDTNRPGETRTPEQVRAQVEQVRASLEPTVAKLRQLAAEDSQEWETFLRHVEARVTDLDRQLAA